MNYQQARRALEIFEDYYIGQDQSELWEYAVSKATEEQKQQEIDWNKCLGAVVECASNGNREVLLKYMEDKTVYKYETEGYLYKKCKLATPKIVMIPHDGSDQCPVDPEQMVIYYHKHGSRRIEKAGVLLWSGVVYYSPIDLIEDAYGEL